MGDMAWIETIYWGATIIGGTLFILRTILMVVGGGLGHHDYDTHLDGDVGDIHVDHDLGVDHDIPTDHDVHLDHDIYLDADHTDTPFDTDFSFKLLSMQGLTAFFMMFGLVGLTLLKADLAILVTILGGAAAGLFAVWVISLLFYQTKRLQSSGTIVIKNAIGENGSVYLAIPARGSGQVQVPVQGALKIFDAVSVDQKPIKTGEKIQVTDVVDNNTLIVKKI
jgi:membrane protein implicated in regulation of membrane protease activity